MLTLFTEALSTSIYLIIAGVIVLSSWIVLRLLNSERRATLSFALGITTIILPPLLWLSFLRFFAKTFGPVLILLFYTMPTILILIGTLAGVLGIKSKKRIFAIMGLSINMLILLLIGGFFAWKISKTVTLLRWDDRKDEIIAILNEKFGCFAQLNIPPEARIFEEADITGDKIPEALIWNGCTGAYTTHVVLFQFINGKPTMASFIDENGNKLEPEIFLTGSSVMNLNKFGLAGDSQGVYKAMGSVSADTCTINWKIRAFEWDSNLKAFRSDEQLSQKVKQNFSQYFPSYFDPKEGPVFVALKNCSWE